MKEEYKEYRGFWCKEDEEYLNISRERDNSGDAWCFDNKHFSLDSAIDKILQMDYFDGITKYILNRYGIVGFIEFTDFIEKYHSTLKRDNKK